MLSFKVMEDVGFEGTLEEFLKFLREDPQFYYNDKVKKYFISFRKTINRTILDLRIWLGSILLLKQRLMALKSANFPFHYFRFVYTG